MHVIRLSRLAGPIRARYLHVSAVYQANVPISKFEKDVYLPYEKLSNNVKIVRDR
ncbi:unnamed protein product [Nippostrongylus brasiliensis]|uniref:Uncharacterized protein n=1 Tax=Nippostrongylus brasiliensis TaxID=27835 RepID=A0A0N4XIG2_NIPBR|nr:unnamed protein product [Nippostrongylus brasiliensis]